MDIVIVGAGGHGKVVLEIVRAAGQHNPVGFVDADSALAGREVGGVPVIGPVNTLPRLRQQRVGGAIIAIGDNRARVRYAAILAEHGFELVNAIHPTASVGPTAHIGRNVVIGAQAAITAEARIGDSVIINTGAIVEHECEIGEGAHVCPGVALAGRVRIGRGAFIGLGSRVIQCRRIGEFATVGAGAVVIEDVPDGASVVGVPARVIKVAAPEAGESVRS